MTASANTVQSIRESMKKAYTTLDWIAVSNRIMVEIPDEKTRKTLHKEMKNAIQRTKTNINNDSYDFSNDKAIEDFAKDQDVTIGYVLAFCRKRAELSEKKMGELLGVSINSIRVVEKADYRTGTYLPTYKMLEKYAMHFDLDKETRRTIIMHTPLSAINYWDEMWEGTKTMSRSTMIKTIRLLKEMTALEVSQKVGMKQPNYTRIENGQKTNLQRILDILAALNETPDSFLEQICRYTNLDAL